MLIPGVIDPASAAVASVIAALVAGAVGLAGSVIARRTAKEQIDGDHFSRIIAGMQALIDEQRERIDYLEAELTRVRTDVESARRDSFVAARHVADCERELRKARRRIAALEATA